MSSSGSGEEVCCRGLLLRLCGIFLALPSYAYGRVGLGLIWAGFDPCLTNNASVSKLSDPTLTRPDKTLVYFFRPWPGHKYTVHLDPYHVTFWHEAY